METTRRGFLKTAGTLARDRGVFVFPDANAPLLIDLWDHPLDPD